MTAKNLNERINKDRIHSLVSSGLTVNAIRLFELLPTNPVITPSFAADKLSLTLPPISKAFSILEKLEIVEEVTGKKKDRKYHYKNYLEILAPGTEL